MNPTVLKILTEKPRTKTGKPAKTELKKIV